MPDETIELGQVETVLDGLSSPTDEQFVQAVRAYSDGAVASAAAKRSLGGGGAGLPDWWTVDSTPTAEKVTMAGKIVLDPAAGHDGDVPILLLEGNAADMVALSDNGIFWGARMSGGAGNWNNDYVYRFGVLEMRFKTPPDEGGANFWIEAADTSRSTLINDGSIIVYEDYEGDVDVAAFLRPRRLEFYTGPVVAASDAGVISFTYDDDDVAPALILTAKTADASVASATIPLTPA